MSNTTFGHTPAELEEKLATYWQLVEERELVERRVAKARNEKESVNERIFRKVMSEYEAALESMGNRLAPLKNEIEELRRTTDAELKTLEAVTQELEDEVAEARFRQRIGEYDEAAMNEAVGQLQPRIMEAQKQRDLLAAQLEAMDRRRQPETTSTPAPAPEPAPAQTVLASTPELAQPEPVPASQPGPAMPAPVAAAPEAPRAAAQNPAKKETEDLEDPQHWANQLEPVELRESSTVSNPTVTASVVEDEDDDDPLRALSDPAPGHEQTNTSQANATQPQTQPATAAGRAATMAPSYPSLVIRSGVHEGKIVPLLPMTMSIGREHDNNIELKDPEVARYHARVLYEEGRFHVEDLQSSSGTWVNGVRQKRTALSDGDVIRIGGTELGFEFA